MSDYRNWHVGMEVVFIGYPYRSGVFHGREQVQRVQFLEVGKVYKILEITIRQRYVGTKWAGPSIYVGCQDVQYGRVWHHHSGFRRVQPRATDISLFTAMLHDKKERAPA